MSVIDMSWVHQCFRDLTDNTPHSDHDRGFIAGAEAMLLVIEVSAAKYTAEETDLAVEAARDALREAEIARDKAKEILQGRIDMMSKREQPR